MAKLQHVYRRGHIFWWRRIHRLFQGYRIDIRLSLRTSDRLEARDRGAALSALRGQVVSMLEERIKKAVDAPPTEDDLQAIARDAYQEMLARLCDDQRTYPHHAAEHSIANRTWADYYDRLARNGGHIPMVTDEDRMLATLGWDHARIEGLRFAIEHVLAGNPPISRRFIDQRLREHGFEPQNGLRSMVERALYPAYRDACLEAEEQLQAARLRPAASPFRKAAPVGATVEETAVAAAKERDKETDPTAPKGTDPCQDQAMSAFVEQAIRDLAADEKWDAKSGRQARSTVALFELLIGKKPFADYTQADFAAFKRKTLILPERYDMSSAKSREAVLKLVTEREADPAFLKQKKLLRSNRTRNRHISSLRGIYRWAMDNGVQTPAINFESLFIAVSKAKRTRNLRPATPIVDVAKLFSLSIFTGCQPHAGGTGRVVLNARFSSGDTIIHDAFYWVPLLLYYTGARREELCKLRPDDIHGEAGIPHIWIDFTEFGRIKNDHSVRPVPLHSELVRLGFLEFVVECRRRNYDVLFPELRPTNDVQTFGDVYYKNVWKNLKEKGGLTTEATNHGMRHRFSSELKVKEVFSEFRRDVMGQAGGNINEETYSETGPLAQLKLVVEELPSATCHLAPTPMRLPPAAVRKPQPRKRRRND
jgi:integrase